MPSRLAASRASLARSVERADQAPQCDAGLEVDALVVEHDAAARLHLQYDVHQILRIDEPYIEQPGRGINAAISKLRARAFRRQHRQNGAADDVTLAREV